MGKTPESDTPSSGSGEIAVRVKWGSAEHLPTIYANQLYVTHAGREFYVIFGELAALMFDKDNPPEQLEITPVVKLAIAPRNLEGFIRALQDNFEKYQAKLESEREDKEWQ
jgi:hypothetical protein